LQHQPEMLACSGGRGRRGRTQPPFRDGAGPRETRPSSIEAHLSGVDESPVLRRRKGNEHGAGYVRSSEQSRHEFKANEFIAGIEIPVQVKLVESPASPMEFTRSARVSIFNTRLKHAKNILQHYFLLYLDARLCLAFSHALKGSAKQQRFIRKCKIELQKFVCKTCGTTRFLNFAKQTL
jgi:hypothetical protein